MILKKGKYFCAVVCYFASPSSLCSLHESPRAETLSLWKETPKKFHHQYSITHEKVQTTTSMSRLALNNQQWKHLYQLQENKPKRKRSLKGASSHHHIINHATRQGKKRYENLDKMPQTFSLPHLLQLLMGSPFLRL